MLRYICLNTMMNQETFRQRQRERERGEKVGQEGGVTVCDSHREDQLLNPCTISTDSLFSDLEALKICILVM